MKLIFLVYLLLFSELNAQNSCCPESDVMKTKCNPSEGLNCTNGTVFELDRTAFAEENFYMDGNILVYGNGTRKEFPSE